MKRKVIEDIIPYHCYGKVRTLFEWNKCKLCGMEFRREQGWWFRELNDMCHPNYWYPVEYACSDCIRDEDAMIRYLKNEENKRPKLPPKKD